MNLRLIVDVLEPQILERAFQLHLLVALFSDSLLVRKLFGPIIVSPRDLGWIEVVVV